MKLNWNKGENGLLPVIVQDATNKQVLMLGYMNEEAFEKTTSEKRVTFYSRSKKRLWTKGESSENYLDVVSISTDCDSDSILIQANPQGPTCHTGKTSCFEAGEEVRFRESENKFTINDLEKTIHQRIDDQVEGSYTYSLIQKGINKVAQKVGEEAVETVIDAINGKEEDFIYEAGDLMYHYLVLLKAKGYSLHDIEAELAKRHLKK
ncbi:bifunctional phosphoribosyl-AMP cyclohydrolase/phosphoribosyl-ATP diphosphatase HisIE [Nonlabens marinus]|uniref:Histidine biosynthesis bifunctional protein HisIE n=1 Tax=Nonlabens marinus S1-08 TaxID=1454201 RepID=W8VZB9_9FLAO|nr:bifunctional phosphoribosyl-AMP cyclohydrolase/phosphoribosyl-ATP diphosphatase HisIE [Nonlabens marinus]BAO54306.1 phosphoribosyl-AMP cyclohydrolase [Nonlabens marinus S1-08]